MLKTRIIPTLQLVNSSLVKTIKFGRYQYIGDPINTVRIFNELEVDELCILDIRASLEKRKPNLDVLANLADECFMPLSFGGGIRDFELAKRIFSIGFEKIVLNTIAVENPEFVTKVSEHFGSQAVIASIDVKKNLFGNFQVITKDGTEKTKWEPVEWALKLEKLGAGELLITSVDRDGTWGGFEMGIIKEISDSVSIPVIANGGAGTLEHIGSVVKDSHASAVALGSMVVFQKKNMGVLINFPDKKELEETLR